MIGQIKQHQCGYQNNFYTATSIQHKLISNFRRGFFRREFRNSKNRRTMVVFGSYRPTEMFFHLSISQSTTCEGKVNNFYLTPPLPLVSDFYSIGSKLPARNVQQGWTIQYKQLNLHLLFSQLNFVWSFYIQRRWCTKKYEYWGTQILVVPLFYDFEERSQI